MTTPPLPAPARGFISSQPATTWEEGLICGNGTIGANVLSRPLNETIILSHERLFLPDGDPIIPPDTGSHLGEIRQLIDQGEYERATERAFEWSGQEDFRYPDAFVPAFDLNIRMEAVGPVRDYTRSMDFETGVATVHWADELGVFERQLFVSRRDGVVVLRITGPGSGVVNAQLALVPRKLSEALDPGQIERSNQVFASHVSGIEQLAGPASLGYRHTFTRAYPGSIQALEGVARAETTGGDTGTNDPGTLVIRGADQVLLLLDLAPLPDGVASRMDTMTASLAGLPADFEQLLEGHAALHRERFNRVRLDLGGGDDHLRTTEELLAQSTYEEPNRALIEKEFDAGRYNILSSTGELPPTLQGIWAGTYVPDWASDFTHNGNVPSAIAANMMGNLPELMTAYTSYLESIIPELELNARHMFGARGIVLPSRTSTHGYNNALNGRFAGGFWVAGAGWAAQFFYDYYLYTGDRAFLADHALPFMEKAVLFFEDYLYEGPDGKWIFSPTQSPENTPANSNSQGSFNATMDVAVVRELLRHTLAASRELGRNEKKAADWETMLEKLPDTLINEQGLVQEWLTPRLQNNDDHRHASHLYALYNGLPEDIARNPALRAAFKKSIATKLDRHWQDNARGFMSFGLVQLGLAATSLGETELAYHCMQHLVNRFWLNNLASMHNHRTLFNMDISGGMPAVLIKMLVASEPGRIELLPALPAAWPSGTIEGILCRGQIELHSLHWEPRRIELCLSSGRAQCITLESPAPMAATALTGDGASIDSTDMATVHQLTLPPGRTVALTMEHG